MQHALLGLAIAVIVAIAAALAAPAVVNWSDWRTNFESHATALAGAPVRIRGNIEATLLPTPAFVFRDVDIGEPEAGTGVRVGEVRGVLSLGALLRGVFEAEEFVLVRPAMRVAAGGGKGPASQALRAALGATGLVALSRISIERGSFVFDRGGEQTILDDIYAEGEMRSRQGPMRVDAVFRRDGRRWGLRANSGQFSDDRAGRVRLTLEHAGAGTMFDADGMLMLGGLLPRFEGKLIAARRAAPGVPWQVTANAKATEESVALESLELSLGANATPAELAGRVEFEPRRGGKLDGSLSARRIDFDMTAGGEAAKGLPASFASLREVLALLDLPLQGRLGLTVENLVAAGGTLRDVKADIGLRENSLALERIEAKLPGRGSLVASGARTGKELFLGDATLEAEDSSAFARWAFGDKSAPLEDAGPLRLAGKVDWSGGRIQLGGLTFALGETKLGGNVTLEPGASGKRTRIDGNVTANGVDLDVLKPAAEWLRGHSGAADISLGVQGSALRVLGRPLGRIDATMSRTADTVAIERLSIEDFDGLSLRANGRIAAPVERPSGKIEFDLSTTRADGLATIVQELLGDESARLVRHVAGSGNALKLSGSATGAGSAAGVEINAGGRLGDFDATFDANFDLLTESLSEGHVRLEAITPGSFAVLFGFSPGLPAAGNGVLEIDISRPEKGVLPLSARLSAPGAEILAEGALRNGNGGRIEPNLTVKIDATDLRHLLSVAVQSGGNVETGASGSLRLTRNGETFALEDIALKVGGASVTGALTASALTKPTVGGKLTIERMDIANLLAFAVGPARDGKAFWPAVKIGAAPLSGTTGAIDFDVASLALPGQLAAANSKFRLRLGATNAAVEEFTAELAGGRLAGHASFVRGETLSFDGRGSLAGFEIAQLVAPGGTPDIGGRGQLTLSVAGSGATPAAVAASLAGQGTIALEGFEIGRVDPNAVAAVFADDEKSEARDEIAVIAALAPALARGPLRIGKIEAPIVVAAGNARTIRARATVQGNDVAAEVSFDMARLLIDANVEIEAAQSGASTVRPSATVRWRGPVAAPERGIEAAALATAITLRAMERETKRIEERDRALPPLQPRSEQPPSQRNPVASVPSITAPDPTAPAISVAPGVPSPIARPRVIPPPASDLPPLPPATNIRPFPVYPPQN